MVAASVHVGSFQAPVRRWVKAHAEALRSRPTAFVCVCLAVLERSAKVDEKLALILKRFFDATGWQPTESKIVAGALPYRIQTGSSAGSCGASSAGPRANRHEPRPRYTDWKDLAEFTARFGGDDSARRCGESRMTGQTALAAAVCGGLAEALRHASCDAPARFRQRSARWRNPHQHTARHQERGRLEHTQEQPRCEGARHFRAVARHQTRGHRIDRVETELPDPRDVVGRAAENQRPTDVDRRDRESRAASDRDHVANLETLELRHHARFARAIEVAKQLVEPVEL